MIDYHWRNLTLPKMIQDDLTITILTISDCNWLFRPLIYYQLFGYGSIPINTMFSGMNIHLPAILMWTTGVSMGFDTLPFDNYH